MIFYRVFPYDPMARNDEAGHPLFVPTSRYGRVDNPDRYRTLYCSSHAMGAVAEAFGLFSEWSADMLTHGNGCGYALATLTMPGNITDLDDANVLLALGLRPSNVVSRNRKITQSWALRIYDAGGADGVSWWSYYKPEWNSTGLWNRHKTSVQSIEPLSLKHPALLAAAHEIARVIRITPAHG